MGGGARDRGRIAQRLGIRMLDLPYPQSLADIEQSVRTVSTALGRPAAGARRAGADGSAEAQPSGGGGRHDLARRRRPDRGGAGSWRRNGWRWPACASAPMAGDRVSLEQLLVRPPAVILRSDYRQGQYSGEQRWLSHPLARRVRAPAPSPPTGGPGPAWARSSPARSSG